MTTRIEGKGGHISDIVLVCLKFKEIRGAVRSTDTNWADVMEYENGTIQVLS